MNFWKTHLTEGLKEDHFEWDWSTRSVTKNPRLVQASIIAKQKGVWAADGLVEALLMISKEMSSSSLEVQKFTKDGQWFSEKEELIRLNGDAKKILRLERAFLNIASYSCAIATQTKTLVELIESKNLKSSPRLACTRKILPGFQDLAISSVIVGGGCAHRVGLSGGVILKENHLKLSENISSAIEKAKLKTPHGIKIEVEVSNIKELEEALSAKADVIMLDNFEPALVDQALEVVAQSDAKNHFRPTLEVSGGINEENILEYCKEGVDVISVGSLTHRVKSIDLTLLIR